MRHLTFNRPHYLPRLAEELMAAVPALRPRTRNGVREAVCMIAGGGEVPDDNDKMVATPDRIELTVPDEADEAAIAAVVEAHDPTPPPEPAPPPTLAELEQQIDAATDLAELKVAVKRAFRAMRRQ